MSNARRFGGAVRRFAPQSGRGAAQASGPVYLLDYNDATFARASEAAAVDPRDGWAFYDLATPWPGVNVPRILGDGAILIEGSRTNYQKNSEDISAWSLVGDAALTAGQDAPDGASDAYRCTASSGGNRVDQATAILPDTSAGRFSVYVRDAGAGGLHQSHDRTGNLYAVGGSLPGSFARVAVAVPSPTTTIRTSSIADGADRAASGGIAAGARDGIYWGVQSEQGRFDSSPIRTAGSAVTRAVDQLSVASGSVPAAMKSGRFTVTIYPEHNSAVTIADGLDRVLLGFGSGGNNVIKIARASSTAVVRVIQGGAVKVDSNAITYSAHQALTLTLDASAGTVEVSGATTGDGEVTGTSWTMPAGTLYVGNREGYTLPFYGLISRPVAA